RIKMCEGQGRAGAGRGTGWAADGATVTLSALKSNLAASLDLWADVLLHPSFPKEDFERIQRDSITRLKSAKLQPNSMGRRVLPLLAYGAGHPYGRLGGGGGTDALLPAITAEKIADYRSAWVKTNHS